MFISDIGEGTNALFCLTNRRNCCTAEAGDARGSWQFPNSSFVTRDDADLSFDAIRGYSSIHLNRRSDAVTPTGIFICRLPDEATGSGMNLFIGVYDDASEGIRVLMLYKIQFMLSLSLQLLTSLGTESSNQEKSQ